mgnify:CR=1 FL=1
MSAPAASTQNQSPRIAARSAAIWQRAMAWLLCLLAVPAAAQGIDGRYVGEVEGQATVLSLISEGNAVRGIYAEGALELHVEGVLRDGILSATVTEPRTRLQIAVLEGPLRGQALHLSVDAHNPLSGERRRAQATFQREVVGGSELPAAAEASSGARDPNLVGAWQHEKLVTSGGDKFAAFTTVLTMVFAADGTLAQYAQSVGGGSDWSYGGGGRTLQHQGHWHTRDGVLHVRLQGAADSVPAARYRFAGAYLVTEDTNGRMNWKRP